MDILLFKEWRDYVVTKCASSVHQKKLTIILLLSLIVFKEGLLYRVSVIDDSLLCLLNAGDDFSLCPAFLLLLFTVFIISAS
jgi:hypothetical protein